MDKKYDDIPDYLEISKKYDGLVAHNVASHTAWDVPTINIWNKNVIQSIELLGNANEVIQKSKEMRHSTS